MGRLQDFKDLAVLLSILMALGGAAISVAASKLGRRMGQRYGEQALAEAKAEARLSQAGRTRDASPSSVVRGGVLVRIKEATTSREQQLSTQKWSKLAADLLTVAQYIIGGVLASSFVQESLTPK